MRSRTWGPCEEWVKNYIQWSHQSPQSTILLFYTHNQGPVWKKIIGIPPNDHTWGLFLIFTQPHQPSSPVVSKQTRPHLNICILCAHHQPCLSPTFKRLHRTSLLNVAVVSEIYKGTVYSDCVLSPPACKAQRNDDELWQRLSQEERVRAAAGTLEIISFKNPLVSLIVL